MKEPVSAVTMREVAEKAGVDRSTVSRALRNHPAIPESTRLRVLDAARTVGYRPNPLVATLMAQLRSGRSSFEAPALAALDFSIAHPADWGTNAFLQFEAGARTRAAALGFALESFWCNEPGMTPTRLESIFHSRGISGILIPPVPQGGGHPMDLDWSAFAVAGMTSMREEPRINRAGADHFFNVQLALHELMKLGYRRVGFAMTREMSRLSGDRWLGGFHAFHRDREGRTDTAVFMPERLSSGALRTWLERFEPDAVVCMGSNIVTCLESLHVRIPQDLGVATLNRHPLETFFAGIDEDSDSVGAAAVDLLVAHLHRNERGLPAHPYTIQVQGIWRPGASIRSLRR